MAYGDEFWGNVGTGLLSAGAGFYADEEARKRGEQRYQQAQGPLYNKMIEQAGKSLDLAGGMDPKAHAQERYNAWTNLQKPGWEEEDLAIKRANYAQGTSGLSTHAPVSGVAAPEGGMNPRWAAAYAAREKAKEQAGYDALNQGEAYLNNLIGRSTKLQGAATTNTGLVQKQRENIPSKTSWGEKIATSLMNPQTLQGLIKGLPGMIEGAQNLFGGGAGADAASGWQSSGDPYADPFGNDVGMWDTDAGMWDDWMDYDMGYDVDWDIDNVNWDDWDFGSSDEGGYWW